VLTVVTVATGGIAPWLATWAGTRTPDARAHLADLVDDVLFDYQISDLHLGFYNEYAATDELLPWLLSLEPGRLGAAHAEELIQVAAHR